MTSTTALVDGHVHIHGCYPPAEFFDHAYANLSRFGGAQGSAGPRYLLMTECAPDNYFDRLKAGELQTGSWAVRPTAEPGTVAVAQADRRIFVVAGRQVACKEGLEVLVLGTQRRFEDGGGIRDMLQTAAGIGTPHVIPWGPGKWFFSRGRLVHSLVEEFRKPSLFLGDEGGRPGFWGYPNHFTAAAQRGVRDLPGTDPLPFAHDIAKVGRVGLRVPIELDESRPAASLFQSLLDPAVKFERFAKLEPPLRFFRNQVAMQLRKHRPS